MRTIFLALVVAGGLALQGGAVLAGSGGIAGAVAAGIAQPICDYLGMTSACARIAGAPQFFFLGLFNSYITEIAALTNGNPGSVRAIYSLGNLAGGSPINANPNDAVSAVNPPALQQSAFPTLLNLTLLTRPDVSSPAALAVSGLTSSVLLSKPPAILSSLAPLAFISGFQVNGATLLTDPAANSFFYAVTTGTNGEPQTLDLFFDYLPQTQTSFTNGQNVGDISLPLVVRNRDGSERSVAATLQLRAACAGGPGCLTATVVGDFLGINTIQRHSAAEVGATFLFEFGGSPNSAFPHAVFEVQVPLLVTMADDPAYFGMRAAAPVATGVNQISGFPTAFHDDVLGFSPTFLGLATIGVPPIAASYSASFTNNGDGVSHPAVSTTLAIGTDGATLGLAERVCIVLMGSFSNHYFVDLCGS